MVVVTYIHAWYLSHLNKKGHTLQWRHNERDDGCRHNRFVQALIEETSKAPRHWPLWGNHRWPVNSPHKGPVTRSMFPFYYISMSRITLATPFQLLYENGATVQQVRGLIMVSSQCTHTLNMQCFHVKGSRSFWESYYGRVDHFENLGGTFCQQGQLSPVRLLSNIDNDKQ